MLFVVNGKLVFEIFKRIEFVGRAKVFAILFAGALLLAVVSGGKGVSAYALS